LTETVLFWWSI